MLAKSILAAGLCCVLLAGEAIAQDRRAEHFQELPRKIREIEAWSFAQLIENLSDDHIQIFSERADPQLEFQEVLADRNLRRLVAEIERTRADDKPAACREVFEIVFDDYRAMYDGCLKSLRDQDERAQPNVRGRLHAMDCALFVTASHGGLDELAHQLWRLATFRQVTLSQLSEITNVPKSVTKMLPKSMSPKPLVLMNLLWYVSDPQRCDDLERSVSLRAVLIEAERKLQLKRHTMEVVPWNAKVDSYDLGIWYFGEPGEDLELDRSLGSSHVDVWDTDRCSQKVERQIVDDLERVLR